MSASTERRRMHDRRINEDWRGREVKAGTNYAFREDLFNASSESIEEAIPQNGNGRYPTPSRLRRVRQSRGFDRSKNIIVRTAFESAVVVWARTDPDQRLDEDILKGSESLRSFVIAEVRSVSFKSTPVDLSVRRDPLAGAVTIFEAILKVNNLPLPVPVL